MLRQLGKIQYRLKQPSYRIALVYYTSECRGKVPSYCDFKLIVAIGVSTYPQQSGILNLIKCYFYRTLSIGLHTIEAFW